MAVLSAAGLAVLLVVAGVVNGLAGFGFAVLATMGLATVVDPATAVAFLILPMIAVNFTLVRELSPTQLRRCGRRFWPLIGSALLGTVAGMVLLGAVPAGPLRGGLGVLTLGFVATTQQAVPVPGVRRTREGCFVETPGAMAGVGTVSGLLFGGTNVGVQLVAFLRGCDLEHGLFVGVIGLVFVGINAVRVGVAGVLGLYPSLPVVVGSAAAAIPAVAGVALGSRLRHRVSARVRRLTVLGILTVIGGRLVLAAGGL